MKRISTALALALVLALGYFCLHPFPKTAQTVRMPSGASEENGKLRREWQRMRLADPLTGQIPDGIAFLERRFAAGLPQAALDRGGNGEWASRGPWNVGGRTRALAMDVTNENRLLAGASQEACG